MSTVISAPATAVRPQFSVSQLTALALFLVAVAIAVFQPAGLSVTESRTAGLVIATIGFWATGAMAESLVALIFFTVAMLGRIAPADIVFSGLTSSSYWLIFSGIILGAAIRRSGLGDRVAVWIAGYLGESFAGAMIGVVLFGLVMAFFMPSAMGRIVLMMPILMALAGHLGYEPHSLGRRGLLVGGVFGTFLPSTTILPANVPNNVLAGIYETTFGKPLAFGDYLLVHFPVLGVLKTLLLIGLLLYLYRGARKNAVVERHVTGPLSATEQRLAAVLVCALALWATDSLHHISPAWIGMGAAAICLFPASGLLPPKALQSLNLEPLFYVAGIISLGTIVVHSGLGQRLATWALTVLPIHPGADAVNFATLSGLTALVGLLTTVPGVPAVITPLTASFAAASGFSPETVIITQVVGFSTVILPYQAPPLVLALQTGDLPLRDVVRVCLITAALSVLLLWPLDFLWLNFLGRI